MINPYIVEREKRLEEIIQRATNNESLSGDDAKLLAEEYLNTQSCLRVRSSQLEFAKKERDTFMNKWWAASSTARHKAWEDQCQLP